MTENQNPNDDMNKTQMLQEKTVSNANNSKKTGKSTSTAHTDFRISQALYKTILTNLQVILVVFMVALIGWLVWYLSPLTATNTTYNAEAHEKAVSLLVDNLGMADVVNQANAQSTTSASSANPDSNLNIKGTARCDFGKANTQARFSDSINRINQSLTTLYQQKRLANHYQLQTTALWQQACEQQVSEDALLFAFKTLASPERLLQLQWREQQPNRRNQNDPNVAHMPTNWLTQTNPWYGLPGCVYLKTAKTTDNQTGYLYVDNRGTRVNNDDADPLTQLCNNPRLIPASVKTLTGVVTVVNQTADNQHTTASSTKNLNAQTLQTRANDVLQTLQNKPTQDPKKRIPSTNNSEVALPSNLGLMYSELSNIHSNHFDRQLLDAYQSYQQKNDTRNWWQKLTAPPINSINIDGSDIKIGYNMALTLDPEVQTKAQQVADCVTNSPNASVDCNTLLSPSLQSVAGQMYENALVRSIGIAVIDVKTQGVLALASSDSNCYRADNGDTTIKPNGCPTLWKKDWSKQNLMNHALYQTVYPGSIVKTVQALGLVRANPRYKNLGNPETAYLKQVMASSSTERVANFLFCQSTTSSVVLPRDKNGVCQGIPAFKKASDDMGWSANCATKDGLVNCGFKDLLFGKPYNSEPMLQSRYFSGVLLTDAKQDYSAKALQFSAQQIASCVKANGGRMNGSCRQGGDKLNATMNEVFGAGNAKTSVLGASDMFASLLIADNGKQHRRGAHLIEDLWGVNQMPLRPKAWRGDNPNNDLGSTSNLGMLPLNISQTDAKATLNLLSGTLLAGTGLGGGNGTAYAACTQAIGNCGWSSGVVVGKTGTPGFNYPTTQNGRTVYTPNVTVNMVANLCGKADKPSVACHTRPYKWFIYGLKDKNGQWDKAVAVLVERNFNKQGLVDDPRDGINRAVQAGMILAKQMYHGE